MVSFELTKEQERIKAEAAEFAQREILPRAEELDRKDAGIMDVWVAMGKEPYKYTGMHIPAEDGGYPRPLLDIVIIIEELSAIGRSAVCIGLMEGAGMQVAALASHGSEELKRKYLPAFARGESMGCFALTEPGMGSDAAGLNCRAQKDGDGYIINGRKRYASFAHEASYITLFAKTDPTKGSRGISAFIVPTDTPGFKVLERIECIGMRGHQDEELEFKDCRIPKENRLGEENKGLSYALETLDETRTTLTAGFLGLARACLDEAVKYAKARTTFGKPLFHRQALSFPLAEIAAQIDAARLLNFNAAWLHEQGKKHTVETAKAKALATKVMLDAANMAVEVHGGFGCTKRHVVERLYRDARIWSFAQGTLEIMKFIISRHLFGKYEM